ncbi:alpha-glucosidase [Allorhizobium undicola]|uniref:alpha-glucosidase n=1 Tax=Allorhizobium undicola TaxID=78527 RepID=UPI000482D175|nr:alpha-glucosidase [Allorhizobium undicola]
MTLTLTPLSNGFSLAMNGLTLLSHTPESPALYLGCGRERMDMYRGNFDIEDYLEERVPLSRAEVKGDEVHLSFAAGQAPALILTAEVGRLLLRAQDSRFNRFWLRVRAEAGEYVYGGGEQMSYFDMRGRRFPLWTSEPGVGRDKTTEITLRADLSGKAGGDYYHTNYPQPTYVSSRRYALHVDTTAYSVFDFRNEGFHEIEVWAVPQAIEVFAEASFAALVGQLSRRFGRQPMLPDWALDGAIIGLKDGENSLLRLQTILAAGVKVCGLWCEDWVGLRHTSFGARLFWDWQANEARYPNLRDTIARLREKGIRFLGYVNPYLCEDGRLFQEAAAAGFLALDDTGGVALVDFGEFECGVVDFTNPGASSWFAERVIGQNMLDYGLCGWMADFGEYLPIDVHLANGVDARLMHNAWPTIWAEVNARAIASRDMTGEALFFMRAGFTGVQAHCPLLWAGDQSVDFTRHDGLVTVICGALSSGLLGNAYHHSDIGGYTSLFGNVRTGELMMRWAEMAAFTPVMRTHEGNRPKENLQIDQDAEVLAHFARMTRLHGLLKPYFKALCLEASQAGLPLQRPLFLHYETDEAAYSIQDQYLLGADLLVAPVWQANQTQRSLHLPGPERWVHLWSGDVHDGGGEIVVAAPVGLPPVFFRASSPFAALFRTLAEDVPPQG